MKEGWGLSKEMVLVILQGGRIKRCVYEEWMLIGNQ